MAKRIELSEFDEGRIIGVFQFNHFYFLIATQLNIPLGTVKTVIKSFQANVAVPQLRTGRPRKITPKPTVKSHAALVEIEILADKPLKR